MKNSLSHDETNKMVGQLNFNQLIYTRMAALNTNAMRLSLEMGHNRGYVYRQMQHNDQSASLLVLLSHHLQTNLFEPYINLLPEELRSTQREKDLQAKIISLQQQVAELEKERDIYKSIAMK